MQERNFKDPSCPEFSPIERRRETSDSQWKTSWEDVWALEDLRSSDSMQGRIFTDPSCPELNPAERRRVYQAFPATLAALHSVRPADVGLLQYGRAGGYAKRQVQISSSFFATPEAV